MDENPNSPIQSISANTRSVCELVVRLVVCKSGIVCILIQESLMYLLKSNTEVHLFFQLVFFKYDLQFSTKVQVFLRW